MAHQNFAVRDTLPGQGIWKIIDLYHDLPDLVAKADKHATMSTTTLHPEDIDDTDSNDFAGLTEEQIEEEKKE